MTNFARSLALPASRRRPLRRRLAVPLALAATTLAVLTMSAPPAGAIVTSFGGQKYGLAPHATTGTAFIPELNALHYAGGPVMHANSVYTIYWDPAVLRPGDPGSPGKYQGDWQQMINGFLQGVGADSGSLGNVFALTPQYTEAGGARAAYRTTFRGAYVDHHTYPSDGCTDPDHTLNENFACFTDLQLREELGSFITANKLHAGSETIFYLLTPPGVTVCIEAGHCSDSSAANPWGSLSPAEETSYEHSFCSYHSTAPVGGETAVYAAIPWTAGTLGSALKPKNANGSDCQDGTGQIQEPNQAGLSPNGSYDHALPDLIINQIASQQIATVTNPTLTAWYEPLSGNEVTDQCRNWFEEPPVVAGSATPDEHTHAGTLSNQTIGAASYYLNTEYNQAALYNEYPGLNCELHTNLVPSFTAPNPVNAGDIVGFDGNESDITLGQSADPTPSSQPLHRAVFTWSFGDGTSVSGPGYSEENPSAPLYASVFHTYQYGGTYEVTLTVTDAGANTSTVSRQLTVVGSPPPSKASSSGGSSSSSAAASAPAGGAAASTPAGPAKGPLPSPVATTAVVSQSLRRVLSKGLPVRYSVNQQVAGHFEVLLSRATARRLKIGGAPAGGLAAGTPAQVVIGKAILVTTAAGRSIVTIRFSKHTDSRLARMRSVALMLRLVVRNAASANPGTTTVLTKFTLHR